MASVSSRLSRVVGETLFAGRAPRWSQQAQRPRLTPGPEDTLLICEPKDSLKAVDGDTGEIVWEVSESFQAPNLVAKEDQLVVADRGRVVSFDARTGGKNWEKSLEAETSGTPVVDELGRVFLADRAGEISAWSAEGAPLWSLNIGNGSGVRPNVCATGEGRVLVSSGESLKALDSATGETLWSRKTSTPARLKDGHRLVHMYRRLPWLPFVGGTYLAAVDLLTGRELWRRKADRVGVGAGRELVVHNMKNNSVERWSVENGRTQWTQPWEGRRGHTYLDFQSQTLFAHDHVDVRGLDPETGQTLWVEPAGGVALDGTAGDRIYKHHRDQLSCFEKVQPSVREEIRRQFPPDEAVLVETYLANRGDQDLQRLLAAKTANEALVLRLELDEESTEKLVRRHYALDFAPEFPELFARAWPVCRQDTEDTLALATQAARLVEAGHSGEQAFEKVLRGQLAGLDSAPQVEMDLEFDEDLVLFGGIALPRN